MSETGRVQSYYFGFDLTGVEPVDAILRAVARAGKAYHNTSEWADPWNDDEQSQESLIQQAADAAAAEWRKNARARDTEWVEPLT